PGCRRPAGRAAAATRGRRARRGAVVSPPTPFTSTIGSVIARYVALKRALGRRFDTQRYLLARFDGFLAARHATDLTAETFSAWCVSSTHLMPSGRRMRMQMVRQFCLYRRRSDAVVSTNSIHA